MKQSVSYWLMNPTNNITILVETPVDAASQPFIASELMKLEPSAEQVGFVTPLSGPVNRTRDVQNEQTAPARSLRMAGGEFCGNASMCAAVYYASHEGMHTGTLPLRVSGAAAPVDVTVTITDTEADVSEGTAHASTQDQHCAANSGTQDQHCALLAEPAQNKCWRGTVHMPSPERIQEIQFPDGSVHPVVSFAGISHVILTDVMPSAEAEAIAPKWCRFLHVEALGLMFLDTQHGGQTHDTLSLHMTPLVYVPAADTLFWESSCASGTTAVGACLSQNTDGPFRLRLQQPGGTLEVSKDADSALYLTGTVSIQACRTALI